MIILVANDRRRVVAWQWPWGENEIFSAAKTLHPSKVGKLSKAAHDFAVSIKDFISHTSHETGGLVLTEESAQEDLKEFRKRIERFEVVANPIISAAMSLSNEIEARGVDAPFEFDDPVKGRRVGIDELYVSIFDTAKAAEKHWSEDAFRRVYLSIIAGRMVGFHEAVSDWAATYAEPTFLRKLDRMKKIDRVEYPGEKDEPEKPAAIPVPPSLEEAPATKQRLKMDAWPAEVPYFASTGKETKRRPYQAKSKDQLREDVLDALRANRDKLPDDLKGSFPGLVEYFRMMSRLKVAGILEGVYGQRKADISRLLKNFYGADYGRVKDFERGVLELIEGVWNAEDFPEWQPDSIEEAIETAKGMIDRGEDRQKVVDEISRMLTRLSGGKEFKLNELVSKNPRLFGSNPEFKEALHNVTQDIRGRLSAPASPLPGRYTPKAVPSAPAPSEPVAPEATPSPAPAVQEVEDIPATSEEIAVQTPQPPMAPPTLRPKFLPVTVPRKSKGKPRI